MDDFALRSRHDSYMLMIVAKTWANLMNIMKKGRSAEGGDRKRDALGRQLSVVAFQPKCETPLFEAPAELSKPFKSLYGDPPTAEDRKR
jgi:hypothetical protein